MAAALSPPAVPPEVLDADSLTPYAVLTRYPGYLEEITQADVREAIRLGEQVVAWATAMIVGQGGSA